MLNIGSATAAATYGKYQGMEDADRYNALQIEREQRLQAGKQSLTTNDQRIQQQDMMLKQLQTEMLKAKAGNARLKAGENYLDVVKALRNAQGNMASVKTDEVDGNNPPEGFDKTQYQYNPETNKYSKSYKEYNIPKEVTDAVEGFKQSVVYDQAGADWINNFLDSKYGTMSNPIIDVKYNGPSDELVLTQKDGTQIPMSPAFMGVAMGFRDQAKYADQNLIDEYSAESERLHKYNKGLLEEAKLKGQVAKEYSMADKNRHQSRYYDAQAGLAGEKANTEKARQYSLYTKGSELSPKQQEVKNKEEIKQRVTNLKSQLNLSDSDYATQISEDPDALNAIKGKGKQAEAFEKAVAANTILQSQKDVKELLQTITKLTGNQTLDNYALNTLAKYGIRADEYKDTATLINRLELEAKQLAANSIKFLSGAAFSDKELEIQMNGLVAILNGESAETAEAKLDGNMNAWSRNVAQYSAALDSGTRKLTRGLAENAMMEAVKLKKSLGESYENRERYRLNLELDELETDEQKLEYFNKLDKNLQKLLIEQRKRELGANNE